MPSDISPESFQLAMVLTGAGVTVSAALIATVILLLKRLPALGAAIDAEREGFVAEILALVLVGYAYLATTPNRDPINAFAAFLAFVAIAGLASSAHAVAAPSNLGKALSGK